MVALYSCVQDVWAAWADRQPPAEYLLHCYNSETIPMRVVVITALAFAAWSCSKPTAPELPALALDTYQPALREQFEKAYSEAKLQPEDAQKAGRLGMILHAYGQYAPAAACYRRARALAPRSFEWAYYLGVVQAAAGENVQAIATLREALRLNADDVLARLKLADLLLSTGKFSESGELYRGVIARQPASAAAYYGLGRVQSALGETAAALEAYRKACELAPKFGAARYGLALLLQQLGRKLEAETHFAAYHAHKIEKPAQDDPLISAVNVLREGAVVHLRRGVTLEKSGRLNDAIAETERALAIDAGLAQAHANLISLYGRAGQYDRAESQYKAALEVTEDSAELHYNFGVLTAERKRYLEAARAFERAIEINPAYAEAHNNLAAMLELQGRHDRALREYQKAVQIKPGFPLAHYKLGRLLLARGDSPAALDHFERALSPRNEQTPMYMFALAAAYNRIGDRAKAISYGRQAKEQAAKLGQAQLAATIDRDLRILERVPAR